MLEAMIRYFLAQDKDKCAMNLLHKFDMVEAKPTATLGSHNIVGALQELNLLYAVKKSEPIHEQSKYQAYIVVTRIPHSIKETPNDGLV